MRPLDLFKLCAGMNDPWLEALAEAAGPGAEAAGRGAEAAAGAIPPATRFARRNWRRSKKMNEERVGRSALSALNEIADNAAIDIKNRGCTPTITNPMIMESGVGPDVTEPWVHASQAAASLGISRKSVCRARSVVSNAIQYFEQLSWSEALASVEVSKFVTGKFGWDETCLRVMMPNERVQELFEELKCDDMPDDDEEKADQEAQEIDAALADGGGRKGMSRVLLQIMQKKLSVCAGGIEGAITPFPSFMRSVTAGEIHANIVAGSQLKDVELRAKDRSPKKSRRRSVRLNRKRIRR